VPIIGGKGGSMKRNRLRACSFGLLAVLAVIAGGVPILLGACGPFTDFTDAAFCPFVLEIFYLGITTGTTPTTYDPASSVTRLQMAAFLSRTVDRVLHRGSRRAALDQFWTTQSATNLAATTIAGGLGSGLIKSDGTDVWVANSVNDTVSRIRTTDGSIVDTFTGVNGAFGVLVAMGKVFVTDTVLNRLYVLNPFPTGTTQVADLGVFPAGIGYDGRRIWTANEGAPGSVSIVTLGTGFVTVSMVTTGFGAPTGVVYDGTNIWVTDQAAGKLLKLDPSGVILQTVTVGSSPTFPTFDGGNIWVPNSTSQSVSVVRAATGAVLATLTGNGIGIPIQAAFDGERVLVTQGTGDSLSLWKASDLTPIAFVSTPSSSHPYGVCSDGVDFWITLPGLSKVARF
jgi:hypothetical protein